MTVKAALITIVSIGVLLPVPSYAEPDLPGLFNGDLADTPRVLRSSVRGSEAASDGTFVDEQGRECELITFEGLGNNQSIGTVRGDVDTTFGSSWLSIIDGDAGGSGNFANEPSPSTIAYYLDQNDISIELSTDMQIVEKGVVG